MSAKKQRAKRSHSPAWARDVAWEPTLEHVVSLMLASNILREHATALKRQLMLRAGWTIEQERWPRFTGPTRLKERWIMPDKSRGYGMFADAWTRFASSQRKIEIKSCPGCIASALGFSNPHLPTCRASR